MKTGNDNLGNFSYEPCISCKMNFPKTETSGNSLNKTAFAEEKVLIGFARHAGIVGFRPVNLLQDIHL